MLNNEGSGCGGGGGGGTGTFFQGANYASAGKDGNISRCLCLHCLNLHLYETEALVNQAT